MLNGRLFLGNQGRLHEEEGISFSVHRPAQINGLHVGLAIIIFYWANFRINLGNLMVSSGILVVLAGASKLYNSEYFKLICHKIIRE
jgi:hypothetical protein